MSLTSPVLNEECFEESSADLWFEDTSQFGGGRPTLRDLVPVDADDGDEVEDWDLVPSGLSEARGEMPCPTWLLIDPPKMAVLGSGGQGVVFRAKDRVTQRHYAIKTLMTKSVTSQLLAKRECEIAVLLSSWRHPCIVNSFRAMQLDEHIICLFLELCSPKSLESVILTSFTSPDRKYVPHQCSLFWLGQVFLALEHLHLKVDLVMCDLKPSNVLLDYEGCAKLSDFGMARNGAFGRTVRWAAYLGTAGYCAPEQVYREACSSATDLYSFGVLAWVLLSGGCKNQVNFPGPPIGDPTGLDASKDDWKLFRDCIKKDTKMGVTHVPSAVQKLLLGVAHRHPEERVTLNEVRACPLFEPLDLPSGSASEKEVRNWIRTSPRVPLDNLRAGSGRLQALWPQALAKLKGIKLDEVRATLSAIVA
eukprot:TRINITY_DN14929_c0_g5_i1.p1 TRINITY_DN14929_c0_g5~~TRINITY_DN14929_c0_g5_i1.p1  ORF type:complete len:420 (-),score=44.64 TRINITY_DN14929_c0_g5_i1:208-1467(-)